MPEKEKRSPLAALLMEIDEKGEAAIAYAEKIDQLMQDEYNRGWSAGYAYAVQFACI